MGLGTVPQQTANEMELKRKIIWTLNLSRGRRDCPA